MELALYHPEHGYYEGAPRVVGKAGDFYTSVSVGSVFGELLGSKFAGSMRVGGEEPERPLAPRGEQAPESARHERGSSTGFQVVEAGAHDGQLARDILSYWRDFQPETFAQVEYRIVEPSVRRQGWQRETLKEFAGKVWWIENMKLVPASGVNGVIFANELLDAFPVRRVGWDAKAQHWFEWGVAVQGERFVLARMQAVGELPLNLPAELLAVLPDGFTTELCPAAADWWREAAGKLRGGWLLTLDYGLRSDDFFRPERKDGTLRAYREHRLEADVLANPGEQDVTAHVNFTALQHAGEAAGLKTQALISQSRFLTAIAEPTMKGGGRFPEWTAQRVRQFQTLTHPEHLGRAFKVLVQAR